MIVRHAFLAMTILGLAACGGSPDEDHANRGAAERATAATGGVELQPGQWEYTTEIVGMSEADLPPELRGGPLPSYSFRYCLTPEEARDPDAFFRSADSDNDDDDSCRFEDFSFSDGRLRATAHCAYDGETSVARLEGRATPTSYELNMDGTVTENGETVRMQTRITARRIGECTAEQLAEQSDKG
jgi:hypothetical protein